MSIGDRMHDLAAGYRPSWEAADVRPLSEQIAEVSVLSGRLTEVTARNEEWWAKQMRVAAGDRARLLASFGIEEETADE